MGRTYSVAQVNSYIKNIFAQDFLLRDISVEGEVSNCNYNSSGHIYFTIKDSGGTLSAVMFAGQRKGLSFTMREGMHIIVRGRIEIYEKGGAYRLYASKIEEAGRGRLYEEFLRLKTELEEMGMFDAAYKKPIPTYAFNIGVLTSPTGAAVQDIIRTVSRRNPYARIVLCPAVVQGEHAASSIVRGIKRLDELQLDVIIVGRGGGSIEDLWAFNEEEVAKAIFDAGTPIISAVGHETDFTIADFVADVRASTPSVAAELASMEYEKFEKGLSELEERMLRLMSMRIEADRKRLREQELRLSAASPGSRLREQLMYSSELLQRLEMLIKENVYRQKARLSDCSGRLSGLSPLKRLEAGYAFVSDADGGRVNSVSGLLKGQELRLDFRDGAVRTLVDEVIYEEK